MDVQEATFLKAITNELESSRDCKFLTDVTITCGYSSFEVHKLILAVNSPFFKAMFTSGMREAQMSEIEIKQCLQSSAVRKILHYMYTGKIDVTEEVEEIFKAAEYFQMSNVSDICLEAMLNSVDHPKHFMVRWNILEAHSKQETTRKLIQKLGEQFNAVYSSDDFLELNEDRLSDLLDVIDRDKHCQEIITALLRWLKRDFCNRKERVNSLFSKMNLAKLPQPFLVQLLENPVFWNLPEMAKIVRSEVVNQFWKRQSSIRVIQFVGSNGLISIQGFNHVNNNWMASSTFQNPFANPVDEIRDVFSYKHHIFFLLPTTIHILNIETHIWDSLTSLAVPCTVSARGTCCNDTIYIVDTNVIQYLKMNTSEIELWKTLNSFPEIPNGYVANVTVYKDCLVLICNNPTVMHCYDDKLHKWMKFDFSDQIEFPVDLSYVRDDTLYLLDGAGYNLLKLNFNLLTTERQLTTTKMCLAGFDPGTVKCFLISDDGSHCHTVDCMGSLREYNLKEDRWTKPPSNYSPQMNTYHHRGMFGNQYLVKTVTPLQSAPVKYSSDLSQFSFGVVSTLHM